MSEFDPLTLMMLSGGIGGGASAPELADLNTKKQMLTMLLMKQMGKGGTQMAGNVAIRQSPFSSIGDALAGVMAAKGLGDVGEEQQKLMQPLLELAAAKRRAEMAGLQDDAALRESLKGAPPFGAPASPTAGMPSLAPTVANADVLAQRQAAPPGPGDLYSQYMQQAQYWAAQAQATGNPKAMAEAQKFLKAAQDAREKYTGAPIVTLDASGKPQYTQFSEFGTQRNQPGATPPPDTQVLDLGGTQQVIDKRTVQPGQAFTKTQTPGEIASNRLGWANYGLTAQNQNKPQLVTDPNSGVTYAVDPRTAQARPVTTATGEPMSRGPKTMTESQAKAAAFVNQMSNASQTLADLEKAGFTGGDLKQQYSIHNAAGEGIPYVPGSGVAQRFFSSEQAQKYDQAQLQWTEGALRFMTGANAPEPEVRRNVRTYFPVPGASSALIEQKAQARKNMEESVRLAAGPGAPPRVPTLAEIEAEIRRRGK